MDKSLLEHMRIDRNYFPRNLSLEEFLKEWRCSWNFQRPAQLEPIEDIEEDV